jgi:hypothetical protein
MGEGKHLKASTVCDDGTVPVDEFVKPTTSLDDVRTRL